MNTLRIDFVSDVVLPVVRSVGLWNGRCTRGEVAADLRFQPFELKSRCRLKAKSPSTCSASTHVRYAIGRNQEAHLRAAPSVS